MATPVTLSRQSWGDPAAVRRALLVHGLSSNGALMWLTATALADEGFFVEAVDLRGHGTSPRALDYSVESYGTDVLHATSPAGSWDLVVGHSLGGASAVWAAARDPRWAKRLILVDPAIHLSGRNFTIISASIARSFEDSSLESVQTEHTNWHPNDQELKAQANHQASRWAIEQTLEQNATSWDVRAEASQLATPTHIIGADPAVFSIFAGDLVTEVLTNPAITYSVVAGAGHSPHRDLPDDYLQHLSDALNS